MTKKRNLLRDKSMTLEKLLKTKKKESKSKKEKCKKNKSKLAKILHKNQSQFQRKCKKKTQKYPKRPLEKSKSRNREESFKARNSPVNRRLYKK